MTPIEHVNQAWSQVKELEKQRQHLAEGYNVEFNPYDFYPRAEYRRTLEDTPTFNVSTPGRRSVGEMFRSIFNDDVCRMILAHSYCNRNPDLRADFSRQALSMRDLFLYLSERVYIYAQRSTVKYSILTLGVA